MASTTITWYYTIQYTLFTYAQTLTASHLNLLHGVKKQNNAKN